MTVKDKIVETIMSKISDDQILVSGYFCKGLVRYTSVYRDSTSFSSFNRPVKTLKTMSKYMGGRTYTLVKSFDYDGDMGMKYFFRILEEEV